MAEYIGYFGEGNLGITGDLAYKKLFPALYELALDGIRPQVIGVARSDRDDESIRQRASVLVTSNFDASSAFAPVLPLATLAFAVPDPAKRDTWQQRLAALSERKEAIERELARTSPAFRKLSLPQNSNPAGVKPEAGRPSLETDDPGKSP